MRGQLDLIVPESESADILEMYVPKRSAYLSRLYEFLGDAIKPMAEAVFSPPNVRLRGFSVYEVDGAYAGNERTHEERVLVVRLVFPKSQTAEHPSVRSLANELVRITARQEEEIWIIKYGSSRVFSIKNQTATNPR
jgi:hypothetical protein